MFKKFACLAVSAVMISGIFVSCEKKMVTLKDVDILNFSQPSQGEEIAVITVKDYGDIKIKLFPEECPSGVENFKSLISEYEYYDNTSFHRVIKDFMIQGGDPTGTGSGGNSKWGKGFSQEINPGLCHFSGALAYAVGEDKLNGSQFYIVTGLTDISADDFQKLANSDTPKYYPSNVIDMYYEKGGYPYLDGDYEVFGQVFEGLDICFEIASAETDENDRPLEAIVIEKAEITEYNE